MDTLRKYQYWIGGLVWLAVGFVYWQSARPGHDWGGDFSVYVWQAQNFAEGRPYTTRTFEMTPAAARNHPAIYPPLTSLLLSTVIGQWPDFLPLKRFLVFFLWLSLPVWVRIGVRNGLPPGLAMGGVFVFATSWMAWHVKEMVGSECLYVFLTSITLLWALEAEARGWTQRYAIVSGVVFGVLLLLCYSTRAAALALIAGSLAALVVRARRLERWTLTAALTVGVGLVVYNRWIYDAGGQYGNQFMFMPALYLKGLGYYVTGHAALWTGSPSAPRYALTLLFLTGLLWMVWRRLTRPTVCEGYLAVSLVMLMLYTISFNARYAVGLFPLVLLLGLAGLRDLGERLPFPRWALPTATLALAIVMLVPVWRGYETGLVKEGPALSSFQALTSYLRNQPGTVLSWNPRLFALYTGKPSQYYPIKPGEPQPAGPAHLVFYEPQDRRVMEKFMTQNAEQWKMVWTDGPFRVFARPEGAPPR